MGFSVWLDQHVFLTFSTDSKLTCCTELFDVQCACFPRVRLSHVNSLFGTKIFLCELIVKGKVGTVFGQTITARERHSVKFPIESPLIQ